ncbi:uncharacterized protein LOC110445365 [Mizuhopecten yessoensis]|uniref:Uncharacterized protein n=1 Tax=Mizuhopecten yessoensis TaxID=6573 RepID=A0A210QZY4_MIZYE|nr:uncharacterized protein LOC110445365 [Mizuhopecten yessoensis]OWF54272.1 hypothetical protein KP79_PYT23778 [Mizuhopecten yessoensis]
MKSDSKSMTLETSVGSVPKRPAYTRHTTKNVPRRQWLGARRRISSVSFDIQPIEENLYEEKYVSLGRNKDHNSYRRMSAPELPPIEYRAKYSPTQLVLQGSLLRRTSYTGRAGSHPHSATSDGSLRGQTAKSPLSANSSSSGQSLGQQGKSGNIGLNRGKTWCVPEQTEQTDVGSPRTELGKRKPVGVTQNQITPRSTRLQFRTSHLSSKDNSLSSGNNNTTSLRRPLPHCKSDSRIIAPIEEFQKSKTFIKRNSEQKLNDKNAKNNQRTLSIDKTETLTRSKTTAGNVNGMRRYSSTFVLNFNNKSSENISSTTEQENDDSDSDSNKDQYIINWIIGVQSEETEIPPEPEIEYHDVPPQTDTAVHIVHED